MKDGLEKFIQHNREQFEKEIPSAEIWERLQERLSEARDQKRREGRIHRLSRSGRRWLSAAAVFFIGLSLAAFIRTYEVKSRLADTAIPSDLADAQAFYENRIALRIERIKSLESQKNQPADTSLWQLFGQKDEEYERIRKDLHNNPGNAHVRAAFIEYYRARLEMLKRVETHLSKK